MKVYVCQFDYHTEGLTEPKIVTLQQEVAEAWLKGVNDAGSSGKVTEWEVAPYPPQEMETGVLKGRL